MSKLASALPGMEMVRRRPYDAAPARPGRVTATMRSAGRAKAIRRFITSSVRLKLAPMIGAGLEPRCGAAPNPECRAAPAADAPIRPARTVTIMKRFSQGGLQEGVPSYSRVLQAR